MDSLSSPGQEDDQAPSLRQDQHHHADDVSTGSKFGTVQSGPPGAGTENVSSCAEPLGQRMDTSSGLMALALRADSQQGNDGSPERTSYHRPPMQDWPSGEGRSGAAILQSPGGAAEAGQDALYVSPQTYAELQLGADGSDAQDRQRDANPYLGSNTTSPSTNAGEEQDDSQSGGQATTGSQQSRPSLPPADVATDLDPSMRRQAPRSDGAPRRPMNAFLLFSRYRRKEVQLAGGTSITTAQFSAQLGEEWRSLPEERRSFWRDQAAQVRDQFNRQFPTYRYSRSKKRSKSEQLRQSHDLDSGFNTSTSSAGNGSRMFDMTPSGSTAAASGAHSGRVGMTPLPGPRHSYPLSLWSPSTAALGTNAPSTSAYDRHQALAGTSAAHGHSNWWHTATNTSTRDYGSTSSQPWNPILAAASNSSSSSTFEPSFGAHRYEHAGTSNSTSSLTALSSSSLSGWKWPNDASLTLDNGPRYGHEWNGQQGSSHAQPSLSAAAPTEAHQAHPQSRQWPAASMRLDMSSTGPSAHSVMVPSMPPTPSQTLASWPASSFSAPVPPGLARASLASNAAVSTEMAPPAARTHSFSQMSLAEQAFRGGIPSSTSAANMVPTTTPSPYSMPIATGLTGGLPSVDSALSSSTTTTTTSASTVTDSRSTDAIPGLDSGSGGGMLYAQTANEYQFVAATAAANNLSAFNFALRPPPAPLFERMGMDVGAGAGAGAGAGGVGGQAGPGVVVPRTQHALPPPTTEFRSQGEDGTGTGTYEAAGHALSARRELGGSSKLKELDDGQREEGGEVPTAMD